MAICSLPRFININKTCNFEFLGFRYMLNVYVLHSKFRIKRCKCDTIYNNFIISCLEWFCATSVLMRNTMSVWGKWACLTVNANNVKNDARRITYGFI